MHNPEGKLGHSEEDFNLTPCRMPQADAEKNWQFQASFSNSRSRRKSASRSSTIQPSTSGNAANFRKL